MTTGRRSADELVAEARRHIRRVEPGEVADFLGSDGLLIDIRSEAQRADAGALPGALAIERNVLEWRLDPAGAHRLPAIEGYDTPIVVACAQGYASSFAARSLVEMGHRHVADLTGGAEAWKAAGLPMARSASALPRRRQTHD